jgi:cell division protein ZapE
MTPLERYQQDLLRPDFKRDAAQLFAIEKLQSLFELLMDEQKASNQRTFLAKFKVKVSGKSAQEPIKGLYFWGGVGRGKTYLMDIFFDCLPFDNKMRSHFHRFMQYVHAELKALEGNKNPLDMIAAKISRQARVICFDEFFVSDITDAMILGGLFEKLFDLGVTLVATSNIVPDDLYKNGLQRQRFLPAIEQLKKHCEVLNIDGGVDYRLRALEQAQLYYSPLGEAADASLMKSLLSLAPDELHENILVEVNHRQLHSRFEADDVVWFDFKELCDGPRSQNDYIELARIYHAVILSNVPFLDSSREDQARRFINLIDEFYDRNVKLVVSAEVAIADLYAGSKLKFEFERTQSRLLEMQSHNYLAAEHRP